MKRPPTLTPEQRAAGRQAALRSRAIRSEVKERLKSGHLTLAELVQMARTTSPHGDAVSKLRVDEVLLSLPRVGPVLADRILVSADVIGARRISALGHHQVARLLAEVTE
ncbi:MAG: integration host factor, actinobacterial type [Candidatus Nanopelagicales bacterium]|nr:integration host factor, actinobacterial type [Candidatus Nanopelagicales bacterium]MDZ4250825.1 integration host factor, actinobacterial type [Candidatus Nanopelagicales bacterium]